MSFIHPFDTISRQIGLEISFHSFALEFVSIIGSIKHNQFNHVLMRMSYFLISTLCTPMKFLFKSKDEHGLGDFSPLPPMSSKIN